MEKEQNLIGLSLSGCIRDMVEGRVDPSCVKMIVAGTKWNFPAQLEEAIENYTYGGYSKEYEIKFRETLEFFHYSGRLIQPRNYGIPAANVAGGHWAVQCHTECLPDDVQPTWQKVGHFEVLLEEGANGRN
jgi:hypothetical protein